MKRLFILSAAVAALASCSNSEVITEVNEPQVSDKAIAFETFSSNATRDGAENSGQTSTDVLFKHHETFEVWGYKDVQPTYVFGTEGTTDNSKSTDGVLVSGTENSAANPVTYSWTYSPVHFWDKNANSYEFYASAPGTADFVLNKNYEDKQDDDYFMLSDVTLYNTTLSSTNYSQFMKSGQVSNSIANTGETTPENNPTDINTDYMIANACNVANTNFGKSVQLYFNHILSRLNITVKKGATLNNATLNVVSLEVNNMVSTGNFDESRKSGDDLSKGTTERWTPSTNNNKVNYVANRFANIKNTYSGNDGNYILQSLVLPQKVKYEKISLDGKVGDNRTGISNETQPYMKIVYTIETTDSQSTTTNSETYTAYYNLAAVFGADATNNTTIAFNEGWQNTLNITIDAAQITFTPNVYQWQYTDPSSTIEIGKVNQNP